MNVTSVHVANVGPTGVLFRAPKPKSVPGLISADGGTTSILGPAYLPRLQPTRVGMIAFWEDEQALDDFLASDDTAPRLADGWRAVLEPVRSYGEWPGLDPDLRHTRSIETEGPVVVTTLARLRWRRAHRFFATSAKAEGEVRSAPGSIWTCGFGAPPFLGTISIWESAQAVTAYAYSKGTAHHQAIAADREDSFHHQKAFVRYRPLRAAGSVDGKNPLAEGALTIA